MNLLNILDGYKPYETLKKEISKESGAVSLAGITEAAQIQLIGALSQKRGALVVVYSENEAQSIVRELALYTDKAVLFPEKEYVFHNIDARNHERELARLAALERIKTGAIVVASVSACLSYTLPAKKFETLSFEISVGDEYDTDTIVENLVKMGYKRTDMTEVCGQFSVRGGIIDVFSPNNFEPVRIEFFDNEVDSLRFFDSADQRSRANIESCTIVPVSELCLYDEEKKKLLDIIDKGIKSKKTSSELEAVILQERERLTEGEIFPAVDKYVGLFYEKIPSICEYLSDDTIVFMIEPKRLNERAKTLEWEEGETVSELLGKAMLPKTPMPWKSYKEFCEDIADRNRVSMNLLAHTSLDFKYTQIVDFVTKSTVSLHGKIDYLYDDLNEWKKQGATVVILASSASKGKNLSGTLNDKGFNSVYKDSSDDFEKGSITVIKGSAKKGFEYPELSFVLVSEQDIFNADKAKREKKIDKARRIKAYSDINVGDYVVHRAHGIGEYCGIKKMEVAGVTKDYFQIKYQGTDTLYVPVDQMDMLYKYVGSGEKNIKLNKLGGSEWNKAKQRVKTATADMAKQIVQLYAEREHTKGFAFSGDTPWQRDFEDTFLYSETPDQLRSIEEVKNDMEKEKPMDRLLCGDVGYGKTEIAIRAAFKAATDSKQVIYLCPTTILAMQHYETFKKRMSDFPISIEMLSRFRTDKEQKVILKKIKTGEIDIIIGTHRLLQKDVEFKDAGLLIIDEEQRFGVADKERIKELKKNIDVLSMTATPIPRTLHMAMLSVRDMSLLETPPENRYPVETYVMEHNTIILADAMRKELARGGQVFYLYNRIQGIYTVAENIRKLLPDARIAVAHGRMKEDELEDIMYNMVNGDTDILVCTTIIETGLDIPNANTIIIENADRMGLSQLYQLRGRVGRSTRSAYAYMTYKRDKVLSETAQKRLSAIREFIEFGSGFKIAMRDLEIRGAGNILGAQQHGHMDSVGYDMYCRLLSESVKEVRGEQTKSETDVLIDISVDAYIPEKYIRNQNQRIDTYKQIAAINSDDDAAEVIDEIIDRFGDIPKAVLNLIKISEIKVVASECGVVEISEKQGGRFVITFEKDSLMPETAIALITKFPKSVRLGTTDVPQITYFEKELKNKLSNVKFVLQTILSLKNDVE
ncbi:MAG: transcription-repair coupling factor [Eubacteriales bacterium]|nr:transcription-repair coupling factor [Eubacteriales bacterium]